MSNENEKKAEQDRFQAEQDRLNAAIEKLSQKKAQDAMGKLAEEYKAAVSAPSCPNCGRCHQCGRLYPRPYEYPYYQRPWFNPRYPWATYSFSDGNWQ